VQHHAAGLRHEQDDQGADDQRSRQQDRLGARQAAQREQRERNQADPGRGRERAQPRDRAEQRERDQEGEEKRPDAARDVGQC
jgi:hypothetical protein